MLGLGNTLMGGALSRDLTNSKSIFFDGINDYVDGSTVAGDINTQTGTFSIWVKLTVGSNNDGMWQISIGTSGNNKIGCIHNTGSDVIRFFYKGDSTQVNADYSIAEGVLISTGWTHVLGTWDAGTADQIKLYINGSLEDTTGSLTDFDGTPDRSILGKGANANNTYWKGYLDEFSLWNRVLDSSEISVIYNSGKPKDLTDGHSTGLLQWLRFEESSGTINDYSGNNNTASAEGATQNQSETP